MSKRPPAVPRRKIRLRALVAALVSCLALTAALLAVLRRGPQPLETPDEAVKAEAATSSTPHDSDISSPPAESMTSEAAGRLLWASPTAGPPISMAWTPEGAQCFVYLRPAALVVHPEGDKVLAALGPWGRAMLDRLREVTGAELTEIDAVLVSIVLGDDGKLDACLRVELAAPWDDAKLARRLPNGRDAGIGKSHVRLVGDRAYALRDVGEKQGGVLVVCPASLAHELTEAAGDPPPLVRDLEDVIAHTDSQRHATIIFSPRFLQAGGSELVAGVAAPLRDGLLWLADRDATAIAVSAHWDQDFYVELRAAPALNVSPRRLASKLVDRAREAPGAIEAVIAASSWSPYGRDVLERLPQMLRSLAEFTRSGDDDQTAVLNCYLPAPAGHNLLTAAELLLTQRAGDAATAAAEPVAKLPESIDDRLARRTSLSFPKDSLQRALELLSDEIGVPIDIAGADLQLEGITRNQTLAIDLRDRPGGEILVEILRRANPDRAATSAADPRQKLVYVVEPAAAGAPGRIIVTTRSAAEKRGQALPAEFLGTAR